MAKPESFPAAFVEGFSVSEGKQTYRIKLSNVGQLLLPSGGIVACDPLVFPETKSFARRVVPGSYPVQLAVANIKTDQRVALARIIFKEAPIARWEMAVIPGQDAKSLKADHAFGYCVDAGTGCFMDSDTAAVLLKKMDENRDFFMALTDEMDKTYVHTWSWINFPLDGTSKHNLVAFSSGWGDGFYTSWWALSANDEPLELVTDFGVLP